MSLSHHQDHLDELSGVVGKTATEPQKREDAAQADVRREDLTDRHSRVAARAAILEVHVMYELSWGKLTKRKISAGDALVVMAL